VKNATVTGKTKTSKINFQNIPVHTALGRELLKAFKAHFEKKGK